jgi:tRNA-specific 2-thiouridylase
MSGGVDSAVSAALLRQQGHNVTGVTMNLTGNEHVDWAERAADILGIPLSVIDLRRRFKADVIDSFVHAYKRGLTPNPCVTCNFEIKFGALLEYAMSHGADMLATGHYARITGSGEIASSAKNSLFAMTERRDKMTERHDSGFKLLRGKDTAKDQSYFLYRLTQRQLSTVLFPLGEMNKTDIQQTARELGLPQADLAESQDACFIPGGRCGPFIDEVSGGSREPGDIIDVDGAILGRHNGICAFTVGQRKGLKLGGMAEDEGDTQPLYVLSINPRTKSVTVGPRELGYKKLVQIEDLTWIKGAAPAKEFTCQVKIRYNSPMAQATAINGIEAVSVLFDEPQFAPAPGQSLVFYDGDECLGGGVISA